LRTVPYGSESSSGLRTAGQQPSVKEGKKGDLRSRIPFQAWPQGKQQSLRRTMTSKFSFRYVAVLKQNSTEN
jgi:hypothetical protein